MSPVSRHSCRWPVRPRAFQSSFASSFADLRICRRSRVCGVDPTGTLYIGFTKSLRTCLRILVLTNDPNVPLGTGHAFMPAKLRKSFPLRLRAVAWQRSASYDLARNGEKKLTLNLPLVVFSAPMKSPRQNALIVSGATQAATV